MRRFMILIAAFALALVFAAQPPHLTRIAADTQGSPHLEVDADPTNGARPCDPIDATRTVSAEAATYDIAVCVDDGPGIGPAGFELTVIWSGGVAIPIERPSAAPSFDDNPDYNDAPGPNGNGAGSYWDCSGLATHFPTGDNPGTPATDAYIVCVNIALEAGELTASPGLLATITMQVTGPGTETFAFVTNGSASIIYDYNPDPGFICGYDVSCPGATVVQALADADGDGIGDATDNCPAIANPGQQNSDHEIDNGTGIAEKDVSVPNAASDSDGDACETDGDADNDGLTDASEAPLATCGAFDGAAPSHPNPAGGDLTNDDNANGVPAPADATDNGPSWDTDNDGVLDGAECQLGSNPRSALSKPSGASCGGAVDADGDGLTASAERCKWGTSDTAAAGLDSDGDGNQDCVEANDTNGDGVQNFPGDTVNSAKASIGIIGKTMDFDLNGDGVVNFPGDTILSAKLVNHVGGICP